MTPMALVATNRRGRRRAARWRASIASEDALRGRQGHDHAGPCPPDDLGGRPGHDVAGRRITDRWSLSRYVPGTETRGSRVGSFPSRKAAISAAYGEQNQS